MTKVYSAAVDIIQTRQRLTGLHRWRWLLWSSLAVAAVLSSVRFLAATRA